MHCTIEKSFSDKSMAAPNDLPDTASLQFDSQKHETWQKVCVYDKKIFNREWNLRFDCLVTLWEI